MTGAEAKEDFTRIRITPLTPVTGDVIYDDSLWQTDDTNGFHMVDEYVLQFGGPPDHEPLFSHTGVPEEVMAESLKHRLPRLLGDRLVTMRTARMVAKVFEESLGLDPHSSKVLAKQTVSYLVGHELVGPEDILEQVDMTKPPNQYKCPSWTR